MVSTTIAAEVTSVIRGFGNGMETQGRALGTSMRDLVLSAGVREASRARFAREIQMSPAQVLIWIAGALEAATSLLGTEIVDVEPRGRRVPGDFVIVDRSLTRC